MPNFHKKIISELTRTLLDSDKLSEQVTSGFGRSGTIKGKEYQLGGATYHVFYNSEKNFWQVCKRPSMSPEKEFKGGDADTSPDEVWQAFLKIKEQ